MRVLILPGNGCSNVHSSNWYGWLEKKLVKDARIDQVILKNMPDPYRARRSKWVPFITDELMGGDINTNTIIVGHSSGAEAAMRVCEDRKLAGLVLVSACHSDLGEPNERSSGWYPPSGGPWKWQAIRENSNGNIIMLHSTDDPFIPIDEPRHVASSIGCNTVLREFHDKSHFFHPCNEIIQAVIDVLEVALADNFGAF